MAKGEIPDYVLAMLRKGRIADAKAVLERMVLAEPKQRATRELLASVHLQIGDDAFGRGLFAQAAAAYAACLELAPRTLQALFNQGVALYHAGDHDGAARSYSQAVKLVPRFAPAHSALGVLQAEAGNFAQAIELHRLALSIDAQNAEFHNNLGLALDGDNRPAEAVASYDAALRLAQDYGTAWLNRGVALHRLWLLDAALTSIDHALALDSEDAEAWSNRSLVLNDLDRSDEALMADGRATALQPGLANAWANRAATCNQLKRYAEAVASFERAISLGGESLELRGDLLHTRMLLCDWSFWHEDLARIEHGLRVGHAKLQPFVLLPTTASAELQKLASERLVESMQPLPSARCGPYAGHGRVRLAYFSADLRQHPMMFLMAEVFEAHDRTRFETIAFSYGPPTADAMRQRAERAFERFVDVSAMGDEQVAALARSLEVDVAIDLGGFTRHSRPGIFARRVAPVQVNYLGYPGTSGAPYMDYILADQTVIPERLRAHYTEKVAWMPHCYMGNGAWRPTEVGAIDRAEAGLPEHGFVFACFNNSYKVTPDAFDVWMRLLRQVPGSVLWLLQGHESIEANLRREATVRGVDPERLVFAPRVPREAHLQRHNLADLFLDTLHYGAHTTASDALRVGLPVLTRRGETFASRVAASLITTIGTPELIADDLAGYEACALALGSEPARLKQLRARIVANAAHSPLFDVQRFALDIEALYTAMHERSRAGLPAGHLQSLNAVASALPGAS